MIEKFDTNNDGAIDYDEFKSLMLHIYLTFSKISDQER